MTENSPAGEGFLSHLSSEWEIAAIRAEHFGVRVVRLRTGMVLDLSGGALQKMTPPFQMGFGGWLGNGHQWVSWIHLKDLIQLIEFILNNQEVSGAINAVSPQPVTNRVFSLLLAQTMKRPCFLPVPDFVLKILLGEMSEILLSSQRAIPQKAVELGFTFLYPELKSAFESIFNSCRD